MGQLPHYFIAIPLQQRLQQWLRGWQSQLKMNELLAFKQWTHVDDLHITIKFLGGVHDDLLSELLPKLESIHSLSKFDLEIGHIGSFGNETQPRVLWAGVQKSDRLDQLQHNVEDTCAEIGFPREKRVYRPHITLAKKWNGTRLQPQYFSTIAKNYMDIKKTTIDSFVVYRIHPTHSPKYEIIKTIQLTG
ncbi:RNA 2',3'-cyclic phosphodiesterase [Aquibacillus sediminis]|uniref:RNA 2',3'-cyclic phosphodiesterase n=1 Tax=Aquibacillus sediminis TaxID=2574734 RepID=UPI001107D07D|nr:RNA 2',3'-cyclic phosphodiesterase [Aquibacillus sediminis]